MRKVGKKRLLFRIHNWDIFFSLPQHGITKSKFSGVATFYAKQRFEIPSDFLTNVVFAQTGCSWAITDNQVDPQIAAAAKILDTEGRCVTIFIQDGPAIVNLYALASRDDKIRNLLKLAALKCIHKLVNHIIKLHQRKIIICGDLNVIADSMDSAKKAEEDFDAVEQPWIQ